MNETLIPKLGVVTDVRIDTPDVKTFRVVGPDGKKVFEHTYFAAFMNLPYEGGGFRFCPAASADDGLLDIIVMYGVSMPKRIFLLLLALFGKHAALKGAEIHRCREVSVSMDRPLPLHTDGEPGFLQRDIRVSVMEKRLKIIA